MQGSKPTPWQSVCVLRLTSCSDLRLNVESNGFGDKRGLFLLKLRVSSVLGGSLPCQPQYCARIALPGRKKCVNSSVGPGFSSKSVSFGVF